MTFMNHSLIDILQSEPPIYNGDYRSQQELTQLIKRDLQNLLNTRQSIMADCFDEGSYLFRYGIPDLSQFNPRSQADVRLICQAIETAIVLFEPRLQDVSVTVLENDNELNFTVHLQIIGRLVTQQTVSFISTFNPVKQIFQLQESLC